MIIIIIKKKKQKQNYINYFFLEKSEQQSEEKRGTRLNFVIRVAIACSMQIMWTVSKIPNRSESKF